MIKFDYWFQIVMMIIQLEVLKFLFEGFRELHRTYKLLRIKKYTITTDQNFNK